MEAPVDLKFCKEIPKVELHAHLSGSISQKTLQRLYANHPKNQELDFGPNDLILSNATDHKVTFNVFRMLHALIVDLESIQLITEDVINEFYADNVFYLELRSGPKNLLPHTKCQYVETIVQTIQKCMKIHKDMHVTYLVSVDRAKSLENAKENVDIALKFNKLYPNIVVGVDFSGDPSKGNVSDLISVLQKVELSSLKLMTHLGEVNNEEENHELLQLLSFRIGHAVYIHPFHGGSEALLESVHGNSTPIEICLSSNILTGTVNSLQEHPLNIWHKTKHPFVLCTDDKGLFGSDLSNEYMQAAVTLGLSREQVWNLSLSAVQYISASDDVKKALYTLYDKKKKEICA